MARIAHRQGERQHALSAAVEGGDSCEIAVGGVPLARMFVELVEEPCRLLAQLRVNTFAYHRASSKPLRMVVVVLRGDRSRRWRLVENLFVKNSTVRSERIAHSAPVMPGHGVVHGRGVSLSFEHRANAEYFPPKGLIHAPASL